jgi:hypothetical protein
LRNLNSRAAAIVLLLNLLVAFIIGDGPLFHALLLWPSVRAVEATWRLHSRMPERIAEDPSVNLSNGLSFRHTTGQQTISITPTMETDSMPCSVPKVTSTRMIGNRSALRGNFNQMESAFKKVRLIPGALLVTIPLFAGVAEIGRGTGSSEWTWRQWLAMGFAVWSVSGAFRFRSRMVHRSSLERS